MSAPPERIELEPEEIQDRFSRVVAMWIVVATLAAALSGYLLATSERSADRANIRAQRSAVEAMGGLVRALDEAEVDYETFALAEEQRQGSLNAVQQFLFAQVTREAQRRLRLEKTRFDRLAERTQELTGLSTEDEFGPAEDPSFPTRFFAGSRREADRLWALMDAANEEDSEWESRSATYTAILTLFAVALYLLGLSLSIRLRVRRLLAGVGMALVVVGVAWGAALAATPPDRAPDAAAEAFADGRLALATALDPSGYRQAERHYSRAIELRPEFPQAHVERAGARFLAGSPLRTQFAAIATPEAVDASAADLTRALELGLENKRVFGNLGFQTLLRGLRPGAEGLLDESAELTRRAIELDPTDPILHLNLGAALLASGETDEAMAIYTTAAEHLIYVDVAKKELRGAPGIEQAVLSGALTDLEAVASAHPERAEEVMAAKELLVGSVSALEVGASGDDPEPAAVEADAFPAELQWRADLPGFDPESDVVSAQWYYLDPSELGWAAIPNVSGAATVGGEPGAWFDLTSYLTSTFPPACLSDGRYRVELYVNGRLAGGGEVEAAFGNPEAGVMRDLNVGLCRPAEWVRSERSIPGFVGGFVAPDGSEGAYFIRIHNPIEAEDATALSTRFLGLLSDTFADLFPAPPEFTEDVGDGFFLGLDAAVEHSFAYPGGKMLGGAGLAADGAIILGAVFGAEEGFESGGRSFRIYDSLIEFEPLSV